MNLNVAICDDDLTQIQLLNSYIEKYLIQTNHNLSVRSYSIANDLLNDYKTPDCFHILFLDVEMPEINGLELAKRIRALPDKHVKIVFVSNYPEYMQDSFDVHAFHYLQKPLTYERFEDIMFKIIEDIEEDTNSKLTIPIEDCQIVLNIADILYIETLKDLRDTLRVVTISDEYVTKGTIGEYEKKLEGTMFFSPHRSCLVNTNHIQFVYKDKLVLDDNSSLPLSRRREKDIRNMFSTKVLNTHQNNYS